MMVPQAGPEAATRLINFVNASPTPFHAVRTSVLRLEQAGFRKVRLSFVFTRLLLNSSAQLREADEWNGVLQPGGKYYLTR